MTVDRSWQREAVVYQIYPRSFEDADGDGVGDLLGIVERVDYIDDLGADVVWLTPVYESPLADNGYDVSDYRSIHPDYGTMADWKRLRDALHDRDIRLVMDLVVNHTSDEHEWFQRSRRGDPEFRDFYHWREGDPADGPPNNWDSFFGGSAWDYDEERGAWYLHLFDEKQPDLDWREPAVREAVYDMMTWWLERGVDGFRMDVINLLSKTEGLPDGDPDASLTGSEHFVSGPRIHEYLREMHDRVLDDYDVLTIGETPDVSIEEAHRFVAEDGLDMVFPFDHMYVDEGETGPWDIADWDLTEFKAVTSRWQNAIEEGAWISIYLNNHDQPRSVSRFGDEGDLRRESATMLATFLLTLRGTPSIYQGEAVGMTNASFEGLDEYRDVATIQKVKLALKSGDLDAFEEIVEEVNYWSRDNARTPMQWSDGPNAGFTDGEPWIKVNENYTAVNVEREQADPNSVWNHYRRLIEFRQANPVAVYGRYDLVAPEHEEVYAYTRTLDEERLLVVLNFTDGKPTFDSPADADGGSAELVLANYPVEDESLRGPVRLRPYEARVYRLGA